MSTLPSLCVATFRNRFDNEPRAVSYSCPELRERLTQHKPRAQNVGLVF